MDVITDESGGVVERLSYDAFGKRRDATTWAGSPAGSFWTNIAALTHRGFTLHEMLDNVDLIHMNGRVYDPGIGRFLSADPFVQAPLMSQSLNRYSYVMNNPLSLIDPSGYSWLSKAWKGAKRFLKKYIKPIIAIAVAVVATIYLGPAGTSFWATVAKGAIAGAAYGATITALNGGNLQDIARGALTGAIAGGISAAIGYGFGQLISSGQSPVDFGFESLDAGVGDTVAINPEVTGIDSSILRGVSAARDVVPSSRERGFGLRTSETTRAGSRYLINEEPAGLADLRRKHPALVALENDLWSQSLTSGFGKLLQQFGYSGGAQEHMVFVFQSAKGSGPLRFDVRAAQGAANRIEGTFTIPQGFELIAVFHTHPFPFVSGPGGYQRGPSDGLQELDDFDMARSYPNAFHYIRALGHRRNPALEEWYYYGSKAVAP